MNGTPDYCDVCCLDHHDPDACKGKPNGGYYHSCESCHAFIHCSNEIPYYQPCAYNNPPLEWDDNIKTCAFTSTTTRCCS
eukprot:UN04373